MVRFKQGRFNSTIGVRLKIRTSTVAHDRDGNACTAHVCTFKSAEGVPRGCHSVRRRAMMGKIIREQLVLPTNAPCVSICPSVDRRRTVRSVIMFSRMCPQLRDAVSDMSAEARAIAGRSKNRRAIACCHCHSANLGFSGSCVLPKRRLAVVFRSNGVGKLRFNIVFSPSGGKDRL